MPNIDVKRMAVFVGFSTKDNEKIVTKLNYGMQVGQEIPILYYKNDPNKITVNLKEAYINGYITAAVLIIIGLVLISWGLIEIFVRLCQ